jgi:glutamate/tyrosine decarboxylase-like PLP-dependent enzyme
VHRYDENADRLAQSIFRYALDRIRMDRPPLDGPRSPEELGAALAGAVSPGGLGGERAFALYADELAPATVSADHPRFWAFVSIAPTESASMFDLVVGASSTFAGSWMEGAGTAAAENQALRWIADLVGLPSGAGGTFVSGGTMGNLSALVAARHHWRAQARPGDRLLLAATTETHSSVRAVARVMDVDVLEVPVDERGRMTGSALATAMNGHDRVFAVVATAGTTNVGIVDDLAGIAAVCAASGAWFHVDGAYGGAGLAAPSVRHLFDGVEHADSFIVDPHKWLFAPYDCCALLYRDPRIAKAAHTQYAEYLDVYTDAGDWNPSDYAVHLSRRARGMPFWFSLVTHGTDAYRDAIESSISLARETADLIDDRDDLELCLRPELSVVMFRRLGWTLEDYSQWCARLLADQIAFVMPTSWQGETAMRFCFVHPRTTIDDVRLVLETMR